MPSDPKRRATWWLGVGWRQKIGNCRITRHYAKSDVGPMADKSRVNILIRLPTDGNKVSACAEN